MKDTTAVPLTNFTRGLRRIGAKHPAAWIDLIISVPPTLGSNIPWIVSGASAPSMAVRLDTIQKRLYTLLIFRGWGGAPCFAAWVAALSLIDKLHIDRRSLNAQVTVPGADSVQGPELACLPANSRIRKDARILNPKSAFPPPR